MKKQFINSTLIYALCCSALVFGTENVSEDQPVVVTDNCSDDKEHVVVGERPLPASEDYAIQAKRAKLAEKNSDENEGQNNHVEPLKKMIVVSKKGKAHDQEKSDEMQVKKKSIQNGAYITTHPGAFHKPYAIGLFGETVQLFDGSIWTIHPGDRILALTGWLMTDDVVITPNQNKYSPYPMRLTNLRNGASIQAGLSVGPIIGGVFSHWIIDIDYFTDTVWLEDGSEWSMSMFDHSIVKKWLIGDTVIIGVNDGAHSFFNPNILINVNVIQYAIGSCLYY